MSQSSTVSTNTSLSGIQGIGGAEEYGEYADFEITCCEKNCKYVWTFTVGEQKWFDSKGFEYPKRCHACKIEHKSTKRTRPQITNYEDMTINCKDCSQFFTWRAKDQAFYAKQTPPFPKPGRCPSCKQKRNEYFSNKG